MASRAALREASEEAGLEGRLTHALGGAFAYTSSSGRDATAEAFLMRVADAGDVWAESHSRSRLWLSPRDALAALDAQWQRDAVMRAVDAGLLPLS